METKVVEKQEERTAQSGLQVPAVTETQIAQTRKEGLALSSSVLTLAEQLEVKDETTYAAADALLTRIRQGIRTVDGKLDPIIQPIRSGLDQLYALKRELHIPLDEAETTVKGKMSGWQMQERRRIAAQEQQKRETEELLRRKAARKQEEADRLQREAAEADRQVEQASTAKERKEAEEAADELHRQQEAAAHAATKYDVKAAVASVRSVQGPTMAAGSRSTPTKKWRVTDLKALVKGVAEGKVPLAAIEIDQVQVNKYFKADQAMVEGWPGIEVYDDVKIAGRG